MKLFSQWKMIYRTKKNNFVVLFNDTKAAGGHSRNFTNKIFNSKKRRAFHR